MSEKDHDPQDKENKRKEAERMTMVVEFTKIMRRACRNKTGGKREGPYRVYYTNGQLGLEAVYKNGEPQGTIKMYYESGRLGGEAIQKEGTPEWQFREYYENGQLRAEISLKDGRPEGPWKEYYADGQLKTETFYEGERLDDAAGPQDEDEQPEKEDACGGEKPEVKKDPARSDRFWKEGDVHALFKDLYFCFIPKRENQRMYCVGSSDKSAIGSSIELVDYEVYWVNDSAYDIQRVVQKGAHGDLDYGNLNSKSFLSVGEYPHWMFDWSNGYDFIFRLNEKDTVTLNYIKIPKYYRGWDENPFIKIPILNQKGHSVIFSIKECSA